MSAAASGQYSSVVELLSAGAGVNLADSEGDTALYYAASKGNTSVVEVLLSAGANPNHPPGMGGVSPLLFAAQTHLSAFTKQPVPQGRSVDDFMNIAMMLLRAGADPSTMYDANFLLVRDTDRGMLRIEREHVANYLNCDDLYLAWQDPRAQGE
jgi:ankyrin repeat protein